MRRKGLLVVLGLAAVAVAIENFLYFRDMAEGASPSAEYAEVEEETGEDAAEATPVVPMGQQEVAAYLASLPRSDPPRNPFLTREELALVAGAGATASGWPAFAGTLVASTRRVAWLDGLPRSAGDAVGNAWLERIEPGRVVLRSGDQSVLLDLRVATANAAAGARPRDAAEEEGEGDAR